MLKLTALVVIMKVLCGKATFGKGGTSRLCCADQKNNFGGSSFAAMQAMSRFPQVDFQVNWR
jgi:hypothetical protein